MNVINLVSDDDDEESGIRIRRPQKRPRFVKTPSTPPQTSSPQASTRPTPTPQAPTPQTPTPQNQAPGNSDDELVVVSCTKRNEAKTRGGHSRGEGSRFAGRSKDGREDGIECVGEIRGIQALADYPHFRFQCALEQFKHAKAAKKEQYCSLCFCYVCDIPASQCKTWTSHAKAVDTVPKWRSERETRLEERRRKEHCDTTERGTVVSRISVPMRVRTNMDDSSSFENGNSSDALEGDGEDCSGDEMEDVSMRCDFDHTIQRLDRVAIETDCFQMISLQKELEPENLRKESRMARRRQLDLRDLLD